jgi:hypothetical protein
VLEDDVRRGGEALDVQKGEADAAAGELGHGGIGFAAPEAVQMVGGEGVGLAFVVEVEGIPAVEFDLHHGRVPIRSPR